MKFIVFASWKHYSRRRFEISDRCQFTVHSLIYACICFVISGGGEKVNYEVLQFVIELTNVLQAISFSSNHVVYALLNVRFRRALRDIFCCRLTPAAATADLTPRRDQPLAELSRTNNRAAWRRYSAYTNRQRPIELKTTVQHTTSV